MSSTSGLKKVRRVRTPGPYRGVRMRSWGKWVSEIRIPNTGERVWLGSYDVPEKAARAFDAALYCIHGECGRFNFPADKRPVLPQGSVDSLSKRDIQAIATNFASSTGSVSSTPEAHLPLGLPDFPVMGEGNGLEDIGEFLESAPGTVMGMDDASPETVDLDDLLLLDIDWISDWSYD